MRPSIAVITLLFAPGSLSAASVSLFGHARHSADRIGRPTLLSFPASFLLLPAEASLGDLYPVSVALVSSVEAFTPSIGALEALAALSTQAVSVRVTKLQRELTTAAQSCY